MRLLVAADADAARNASVDGLACPQEAALVLPRSGGWFSQASFAKYPSDDTIRTSTCSSV